MRVLILGCGPAGLIAAHAATRMYADVLVFSKKRKSRMFGAQYLHSPIPGISSANEQFRIVYQLMGTADGYRRKVYGDAPGRPVDVSADTLRGIHPAWDIRAAYDKLWALYGHNVHNVDLTGAEDVDSLITWAKADLVISTIPAPLLCLEGHTFGAQQIWSSDQPIFPMPDNTVIVNGGEQAWYRASKIHGYDTLEWPYETKPPIPGLWLVDKPVKTNCTCFSDVARMGRYGKWTKGVLSHEAFGDTQQAIKRKLEEKK